MTRSRITVVESVYHHTPGGTPTVVGPSFSSWLESDEQPVNRTMPNIGQAWTPMYTGWLTEASMVVLCNPDKGTVLEVKYDGSLDCFLIPGGQSMRVVPSSLSLVIRCQEGTGRCTVNLFPK